MVSEKPLMARSDTVCAPEESLQKKEPEQLSGWLGRDCLATIAGLGEVSRIGPAATRAAAVARRVEKIVV
jgi:hypothetical protein